MHSIESWKLLETHGRLWKLMKASIILWNPMKVIRNSKEPFVRPKELFWNRGTHRHTHAQTHISLYWVALCATNYSYYYIFTYIQRWCVFLQRKIGRKMKRKPVIWFNVSTDSLTGRFLVLTKTWMASAVLLSPTRRSHFAPSLLIKPHWHRSWSK